MSPRCKFFLLVIAPTASHLVSLEVSPVALSPSFDSTHFEYGVDVPESVDAVSVAFEFRENSTAQVSGRDEGGCFHSHVDWFVCSDCQCFLPPTPTPPNWGI